MKIIFFGDLAAPLENDVEILHKFITENQLFNDKIVIGNMEGLLLDNKKYSNSLYNSKSIVKLFKNTKKTIFALANNHIKDIPQNFTYTLKILEQNNIGYTGAVKQENKSIIPYEFIVDGLKIAIFSHCWNVMSKIMEDKAKDIYVEDMPYDKYIKHIKDYKQKNPKTMTIVYFHWNFDFEKLPFPSHRIIAKKLIDVGADVIIGSHSHLVNGGETYKGKPIVYGLGNFYIPDGIFFDGSLKYPKESQISMMFEIDTEKGIYTSYWIEKNKQRLNLIKKENFNDGEIINKYSPYRNMDEKDYKKYFKKNRVKKILVPIWYNEKESRMKNIFIVLRMKIFRFIKGVRK